MMTFHDADELPHRGSARIDEWVFAAWSTDIETGRLAGCVSGHRLVNGHAWYWSALVQEGRPLLELTEWDVDLRRDPFVVKAPEMWAEHHCVEPMRQWSIGNEGYFVALDDPDDALGRAYGTPTPVSFDLEWYATQPAVELASAPDRPATGEAPHGYTQDGVVHGRVELLDGALDWTEVAATRWRRWTTAATLAPIALPSVVAHIGLRAPFRFPDGSVTDWVLTSDGFRSRIDRNATLTVPA